MRSSLLVAAWGVFLFAGVLQIPCAQAQSAQPQSTKPHSAKSQSQSAMPSCHSGHFLVMRTSRIVPGGSVQGFKEAMADHAKWYADHGYGADKFTYGTVVNYDRATHKASLSPDTFMTLHWENVEVPHGKHDAGWDSFAAKYKKNSKILSETESCLVG